MGEVKDPPVEKWDFSYRVNLRGPVLLARAFLSDMIRRKYGVFVCVSSSGAAPFMGAYEVFKTAQGELASTIAAEVEGTGVYAFTIGPGIVRTPGFVEGGGQVASFMGKTLDELLEMNKNFEISSEAAGVGFAASIALASKYHCMVQTNSQFVRITKILGMQFSNFIITRLMFAIVKKYPKKPSLKAPAAIAISSFFTSRKHPVKTRKKTIYALSLHQNPNLHK